MAKTKYQLRDRLADFCWYVAKHWKISGFILASVTIFGLYAYQTLLPREGFPSVAFPSAVVSGYSFDKSAEDLDKEILIPLQKSLLETGQATSVQTTAGRGTFYLFAQFDEKISSEQGVTNIKKIIKQEKLSNDQTKFNFTSVNPEKYLNQYDMILSAYSTDNHLRISGYAEDFSEKLEQKSSVKSAEVLKQTADLTDPKTQKTVQAPISFSRVAIKKDGQLKFYDSILIGLKKSAKSDANQLSRDVKKLLSDEQKGDFKTVVSADFSKSVDQQISSLQENIIGGILVVVLVTALLISFRASIISSIFIVSVIAIVMTIFYFVGYSLNVITLFALVLTLGLFVDDATIMVEALDAESATKNKKSAKEIIRQASKRVAVASFAGTMTTALVFVPMLFVSGILGNFIRLLPVTVIASLLVSYLLSVTLVPLLAKMLMTNKPRRRKSWLNLSLVSHKLADSIRWANDKKTINRRLWKYGILGFSFGLVVWSGIMISEIGFNIFPPSKDTDQISVEVTFPDGGNLQKAEQISDQVDQIISDQIGSLGESAYYGYRKLPDQKSATILIELSSFKNRTQTAPEMVAKLKKALDQSLDKNIETSVHPVSVGPPISDYPFRVQIFSEDPKELNKLTEQVNAYLSILEVQSSSGQSIKIEKIKQSSSQVIDRTDGKRMLEISASFDNQNISSSVDAIKNDVQKKFDQTQIDKLAKNAKLSFDFGQESQNAESFSSLALALPLAVLAIFILLAIQFKSLVQPILILLALPFSLPGAVLAMQMTDNSLSFFSMIGFIALVGIAVNNTIMLTDFINQHRQDDRRLDHAVALAVQERFRPLVTTSATTIFALVPLSLSDPFWEPLAVVIIGGLASSTILVLLCFPYVYVKLEQIRSWIKQKISR